MQSDAMKLLIVILAALCLAESAQGSLAFGKSIDSLNYVICFRIYVLRVQLNDRRELFRLLADIQHVQSGALQCGREEHGDLLCDSVFR